MRRLTFQDAVREAEALLRLGQAVVYLDDEDPGLPWGLVDSIEPGGTHRSGIQVNCITTAPHPSGGTFRRFVTIESREADGKGYYMIDVAGCRRVAGLLPLKARREFGAYLADCAAKVAARGAEFLEVAQRQLRMGEDLRQLAAESSAPEVAAR